MNRLKKLWAVLVLTGSTSTGDISESSTGGTSERRRDFCSQRRARTEPSFRDRKSEHRHAEEERPTLPMPVIRREVEFVTQEGLKLPYDFLGHQKNTAQSEGEEITTYFPMISIFKGIAGEFAVESEGKLYKEELSPTDTNEEIIVTGRVNDGNPEINLLIACVAQEISSKDGKVKRSRLILAYDKEKKRWINGETKEHNLWYDEIVGNYTMFLISNDPQAKGWVACAATGFTPRAMTDEEYLFTLNRLTIIESRD